MNCFDIFRAVHAARRGGVRPRGFRAPAARANFFRAARRRFPSSGFSMIVAFPTVRAAIRNLPDAGENFRSASWTGAAICHKLLAEGKFLAFDVDLKHSGQIHSTADVQIEFGENSVRVFSLLGYAEIFLSARPLRAVQSHANSNRSGARGRRKFYFSPPSPRFCCCQAGGCWRRFIFCRSGFSDFFANRDLNFRASWKLSGAALMPGALLMAAGILLYDFGLLNLVSFGFVFAAHFVLGWIYLFVSLLFLPRIPQRLQKGNPFVPRKS